MPSRRITMQDIADACGLSRNTVSKVFNGRGAVPQATRDLVLQKARELGYGTPVEDVQVLPPPVGNIALLTQFIPGQFHFGSAFLAAFTDRISRAGYTLKIYEISPEELKEKMLPPHFIPEQIAGIVGLELFDRDYINMICHLGIPVVMTDGPADAGLSLMECDYVMMENLAAVVSMVRRLLDAGARKIGFVGDYHHCCSFRERWLAFRDGLRIYGVDYDKSLCICEPDDSPYDDSDWLLAHIDRMPSLPDAFICANDYLAIHLMLALKKRKTAIPDTVMIVGFDGTAQSSFTDPPLTTVQIRSEEIGRIAANVLLLRIADPSIPFTWSRIRSTPVWRDSTRNV